MTKIGLDRSGIDAVVGQIETAGVAQHVRVDLHIQSSSFAGTLEHRLKATLIASNNFRGARLVGVTPKTVAKARAAAG